MVFFLAGYNLYLNSSLKEKKLYFNLVVGGSRYVQLHDKDSVSTLLDKAASGIDKLVVH